MAANRLEDPARNSPAPRAGCPTSPGCPMPPGSPSISCYRALDFLAVWSDEIERDVFLKTADLFRLDVDLIFYDTTTAYFEIDEPDETSRNSPAAFTPRCAGAATARKAATTSRR